MNQESYWSFKSLPNFAGQSWGLDDIQQVDQGVLGHFRGLHSLQGGCFRNLWFAKLYLNHNFINIIVDKVLICQLIFSRILWSLKLWYDLYFAKTIFSCCILLHLLPRYAALQKLALCWSFQVVLPLRSDHPPAWATVESNQFFRGGVMNILMRDDTSLHFLLHIHGSFNIFFHRHDLSLPWSATRCLDAELFLTPVQKRIDLKVSDVKWRRPCESVNSDSIFWSTWKLGLELQIWQMSGKVWRL